MICKAIVMKDHALSEKCYDVLNKSSIGVGNEFWINRFDAVRAWDVKVLMESENLVWNWPDSGAKFDEKTKIKKRAYATRNPDNRKACALSHYLLWKECYESGESMLILEHDALFLHKFHCSHLEESKYGMFGLNDPKNATRLPQKFDAIVKKSKDKILPVPTIDRMEVAQGIAGASAYYMKPWAAQEALEAVGEYGLWPNDALLCQQLFDWIAVTSKYYTRVQGTKSTTSN